MLSLLVRIFRIEDTDSTRFVPGAEEYIIESFRWLGITFDEGVSFGGDKGPYRQSERRDIYKTYVKQLLDAGKAYIAFDTPEELEAKRNEIQNFQYDARTRGLMRNSLTLSPEEVDELIKDGKQYVVRFKIEGGQEVLVNDLIRGEVRIKTDILDDKVLYKSADELPTYHLANIVDEIKKHFNGNKPTKCLTDAKWGYKGEFCGILTDDVNKVSFKSFGAGGVNIQRYHFRFKVTKLK